MSAQSNNSTYWQVMKPIQLSDSEVEYAHSLKKYQEYKNATILRFETPLSYEEWKNDNT